MQFICALAAFFVAAAAAGSAASIGGAPAADVDSRAGGPKPPRVTAPPPKVIITLAPSLSPTPPSPPPSPPTLPPLLISPTPPKDGQSGQECAGDFGSLSVPLALQCPQDKPKCVGGLCTTADWGSENFCQDGDWSLPDDSEKDCKWVGMKPKKRCKKKDAFGRKAKKICVAACDLYYGRCG